MSKMQMSNRTTPISRYTAYDTYWKNGCTVRILVLKSSVLWWHSCKYISRSTSTDFLSSKNLELLCFHLQEHSDHQQFLNSCLACSGTKYLSCTAQHYSSISLSQFSQVYSSKIINVLVNHTLKASPVSIK